MPLIDNSVILNSNPTKRIRIAFENMKSNYTDLSAQTYMETYKDQPLAIIIENSRYIFSEPMYGLKFYVESVLSNDNALLFTEYENEKEKIESYLEENGKNMPDAQRKMYEDLLSLVTEKYNDNINTSVIISHACQNESIANEYNTLVDSIYKLENGSEKTDIIKTFMETTESADLFYALAPRLSKLDPEELDYSISANLNRFFKECVVENKTINNDEWAHYIESVIIVSKLYNDANYKENVSALRRKNSMIFEGLAAESVVSQVNELFIEHITESAGANTFNSNTFDCYYSTSTNAVNRIFEDDDTYSIMKDENEKFKMERTKLYETAMNILFEYVSHEYHVCDDLNTPIIGYNFFSEGVTVEDAFTELASSSFISKESTDEEDIDELEEEDDKSSKKVQSPKAKNLANKVQHNAMDNEAKFLKAKATAQQKGMEVKNAAKAVTAVPKNVADSIKKTVAEWDKMDDNRRKDYIIQPGYRKKIFRNLKLALMYGAGASVSLATVPVIAMARHFSKQKNWRIRKELARELETEIKVCDEKIADANANGDTKEKYKLMRIKSDLEKEVLRVKTNSRYV